MQIRGSNTCAWNLTKRSIIYSFYYQVDPICVGKCKSQEGRPPGLEEFDQLTHTPSRGCCSHLVIIVVYSYSINFLADGRKVSWGGCQVLTHSKVIYGLGLISQDTSENPLIKSSFSTTTNTHMHITKQWKCILGGPGTLKAIPQVWSPCVSHSHHSPPPLPIYNN